MYALPHCPCICCQTSFLYQSTLSITSFVYESTCGYRLQKRVQLSYTYRPETMTQKAEEGKVREKWERKRRRKEGRHNRLAGNENKSFPLLESRGGFVTCVLGWRQEGKLSVIVGTFFAARTAWHRLPSFLFLCIEMIAYCPLSR